MEHLQDEIKSYDKLVDVYDKRIGQPPDKFAEKVFKIITSCTRKHSKRPSSMEILHMWKDE